MNSWEVSASAPEKVNDKIYEVLVSSFFTLLKLICEMDCFLFWGGDKPDYYYFAAVSSKWNKSLNYKDFWGRQPLLPPHL